MNILFLLEKFPLYGGVEKITIILSSALQKRGHHLVILSSKGDAYELLQLLDNDVKCVFFPNVLMDSPDNIEFIHDYVKLNKIDIVVNQGMTHVLNNFLIKVTVVNSFPPIISVLHNDPFAFLKNFEYIIQGNGIKSFLKRLFKGIYEQRVRWINKRNLHLASVFSAKFVLLSSSFIDDFEKLVMVGKEKIEIIPNCMECQKININNLLREKKKKLIFVGRIEEVQKRISRLIYIWKEIENDFPDWTLEVIGDGLELDNMKNLSHILNLRNISFIGYQVDVRPYLKEASILCLVSDFEGFGLVLVEGMQLGVIPFSYGSYNSVYDIIDNKVNGFIIPPFDKNVYIKQLKALMSNDAVDLRFSMAVNAEKKSHEFDVCTIVEKWENLFRSL